MFIHGQQLRSDDLARQFRAAEDAMRRLQRENEDLWGRLDQINLALLTVETRLPEDKPQTTQRPAVLYLAPAPLLGTELVGTTVVTERVKKKSALLTDEVSGHGAVSLLRPGEVWADTHPERVATFTARLDPAYLTEYNELVLPYVSGGGLVWRLHHSRGYHEYGPLMTTTVVRFDKPREFNGMVELVSTSRAALDQEYIHAAAGIAAYKSEWTPAGTLQASRHLDVSGRMTIRGVTAYPSQTPLAYRVLLNGAPQLGPLQVSPGDLLHVECEITWQTAVQYLAVEYTLG